MEAELTQGEAGPKGKPLPSPPAEPRPGGRRYGLRHMMAAIVAIALLLWMVRSMGWPFLLLMVLMSPPVMLLSMVIVLIRRRSAQQDGLLWVISTAARRGIPLGPGIEAYAALCSGRYRARTIYLGHLLEAGVSLPEAIARIPDVLPSDAAILAHVGWESGTLAEALADAATVRALKLPAARALALRVAYLCGMLIFIQTVGAFILYFIAPKFEAIFADFGVKLPPVTVFVFRAGNATLASPAVVLLYLVEFAALAYLALTYFGMFRGVFSGLLLGAFPDVARSRDAMAVLRFFLLGGFITAPLSAAFGGFSRRHTAAILRALAACTAGGRPITDGIVTLARYYPQWAIRRRLVRAYHDLQDGADWISSFRARGLIRRSDALVLDAAQRVGNLPWALRELADGIDRRVGYRMMTITQLLFPAIVLALGALVFLAAVAYFVPLIALIENLARSI